MYKKKTGARRFLLEEADKSSSDVDDSAEEEGEDEYDLKDSFVDQNEYSCNGNNTIYKYYIL